LRAVHTAISRFDREIARTIRHSLWARAFYQKQKDAQKNHWVIIRALAYKWIRILFRC